MSRLRPEYHKFKSRLSPKKLDKLLESGYFRGANVMYQFQVNCLDGFLDDNISIRLPLKDYHPSKHIRKIAHRVEREFTVKIGVAFIDDRKNNLFVAHSKRHSGYKAESIEDLLYGDNPFDVFNTYQVEVFHGARLIAFSLFDVGKKSIASLTGVFDAEYSKYSLGIYTMYAEIQWGIREDFDYYYPGHIFNRNKLFDYKLRLGKYEYLDGEDNTWKEFVQKEDLNLAGKHILQKLKDISRLLEDFHIIHELRVYPYYSMGYYSTNIASSFVKSPANLFLPELSDNSKKVIVEYNLDNGNYILAFIKLNKNIVTNQEQNDLNQIIQRQHEWDGYYEYITISSFQNPKALINKILDIRS